MGAVHWNSNILCVIDIETSGTDPAKHDILQIAVLPLGPDLKPDTRLPFFNMDLQPIKPKRFVEPGAMRTNGLDWDHLQQTALDPWKVSEMFESWWQGLGLPLRKAIIPLAHNWPFECRFLHEWLGPVAMEDYFFGYRDSMALANSINDMADMQNEPYPFPKVGLKYLCSQLKVENERAHDALSDCIATAEVYRKMVTMYKVHI